MGFEKKKAAYTRMTNLDFESLTPISPEVMNKQATINFGTIGHVAHGKTTLVKKLSGVQTVRFKSEKERNITIKLGYANCKIYKCRGTCERPMCYAAHPSGTIEDPICKVEGCNSTMELQRHISFVDCPGHDILMQTMLSGTSVMDAAILLIAANEAAPQPQTCEHLAALEVLGLDNIIIVQNKVEVVDEMTCHKHYQDICEFIRGTSAASAPIIPISAILGHNVDVVCEYICTQIPIPKRDFTAKPLMSIIRSFDINRPGALLEDIRGGVVGGTISKGVLHVGQEVEIRPGRVKPHPQFGFECAPLATTVESLHTQEIELEFAVSGGLIGVGTTIDPFSTRNNTLCGHILGLPGHMLPMYRRIVIQYHLLRRIVGLKTDRKLSKVEKLQEGEVLMLSIGPSNASSRISSLNGTECTLDLLALPLCTSVGEKAALSRKINKNWRLIGFARMVSGKTLTSI